MKIYEIGTGYTSIPAQVAAATESIVEELTKSYMIINQPVEILDISTQNRAKHDLPITEIKVPSFFSKDDVSLGIVHKLKRVIYSIALSFGLNDILKKEKEKVVLHFHNQYNLFFFMKLASKKFRSKAVIAYTNHNPYWFRPWNEVKDVLHKRYFQEIAAMRYSDVVFVLNENTKKNIIDHLGISPEKVIEINNGVNTDIYHPVSKEKKEHLKEEHRLGGKKIILQIGSVYDNKGQARSVKMLAPFLKEYDELVYAYAGGIISQEYFEEVKNTAVTLGVENKVFYLGSFAPGEEMNGIYNIADVTVINSQREGFPLVCPESLSTATPVFLCSEKFGDYGKGCLICDENNIEKLILENVINKNERYDALCNDARETAVNCYGWNCIAQSYLSVFNSLL